MTLIGVSGYAGVGKDTIGDILVSSYGYRKVSFADPLREMMAALDPYVTVADGRMLRYGEVLDRLGYTVAKARFPEVRQLLQRLGTEAGRQVLGDDVWVEATLRRIGPDENVVICDVRFPNELAAVKAAGGWSVRVARPGVTAVNAHPSETALDDAGFDSIIVNDSGMLELRSKVDRMMGERLEAAV